MRSLTQIQADVANVYAPAVSPRRTYRAGAIDPRSTGGARRWELERGLVHSIRVVSFEFGQAYGAIGEITGRAGHRQIRRVLGVERDLYTSQDAFDRAVELVHEYTRSKSIVRKNEINHQLERNFDLGLRPIEWAELPLEEV
jgi:hypothetical protein